MYFGSTSKSHSVVLRDHNQADEDSKSCLAAARSGSQNLGKL